MSTSGCVAVAHSRRAQILWDLVSGPIRPEQLTTSVSCDKHPRHHGRFLSLDMQSEGWTRHLLDSSIVQKPSGAGTSRPGVNHLNATRLWSAVVRGFMFDRAYEKLHFFEKMLEEGMLVSRSLVSVESPSSVRTMNSTNQDPVTAFW